MMHSKTWFVGLLLCGSLGVAVSCGGKASVNGTDSNTHWLEECESDGQCGSLSCICGVCTQACDENTDCASLGERTTCEVPAGCNARGPTACVAKSPNSGSGGGGSTGGGSSMGGRGCAPMDARSRDDMGVCLGVLGFAWDGTQCRPLQCPCVGDDCGALFASADDCDHAHRVCYAQHGVSRACVSHSDCVVQDRTCCASCSRADDPGVALMATNDGPSLREAGICAGDPQSGCDPCEPFHYYSVYSACIEGECRLLDLSEHARCQTEADCHLTTKDCCACGGDFSALGLVSVDASFVGHDRCTDIGCAECAGGMPANDSRPACRAGVCAVDFIPL